MKNRMLAGLLFVLSFAIVAFGQPSWHAWLAPVAAIVGYALFWRVLLNFNSKLSRFWVGSIWFTCVQLIQLSWMTSIEFQGIYILFAYFWLASWLGFQFGLLSLLIPKEGPIKASRLLAIASLWTLFEWSRFYFLCGFTWSPSGLALTAHAPSFQMASIGGVLSLSFWVMLTNGCSYNFLDAWLKRKKNDQSDTSRQFFKACALLLVVGAFPYLFGLAHLSYHQRKIAASPPEQKLTVALIQTGLLPPEKLVLPERLHHFISPWDQWKRILTFLKSVESSPLDLIVFPEVAVPFHYDKTIYPYEAVVQALAQQLGEDVKKSLPPLELPYAEQKRVGKDLKWMVSNGFWTQAISNYFGAEVVIGLEHEEREVKKSYNAAFHFMPQCKTIGRAEKQILLPMAEYLPCESFLPFVEKYGIKDFFTKGAETKVFKGRVPLAISICYEETFPI